MPRRKFEVTPSEIPSITEAAFHSPSTEVDLRARVKQLEVELAAAKSKQTLAEQAALEAAQASGLLMQDGAIHEVPSGRKVKMERFDRFEIVGYKDNGQPIRQPKFKMVELPTYLYKIDLPPSGGLDLKINGVPYNHGSVIEVDLDTLRSIKEIVYRCWDHERTINGSNENAYRKEARPIIRMNVRG